LKSCLVLLAAFAVLVFFESRWIQARGLPYAWLAAIVLAGAAALVLGSIQGLADARRNSGAPETPPEQWRDGATIRLGGVIRARQQPLTTPVTGLAAVIYQYELWPQTRTNTMHGRRREGATGMDMTECVIETRWGRLALSGFPSLREIPEQQYSEAHHREAMVLHLASTTWQIRGLAQDGPDLSDMLAASQGDLDKLPLHLVNSRTLDLMPLRTSEDPAADVNESEILRILEEGRWLNAERVIEHGGEVTVTGTYHAEPRRIEIGRALSLAAAQHSIKPGGAGKVAAGEWRTALVMSLLLVLLAGAAHYFVYGAESRYYRAVAGKIAEAR
jgi:hypothetical protein